MIEIRNSPTLRRRDKNSGEIVYVGGQVILTVEAETLIGADLSRRKMDWAFLPSADLRRVNLSRATLAGANLSDCNFGGANLARASMAMANLTGTDFTDAYLRGTWLSGARLHGADLRFAILEDAVLRYARYDETTLWPEGFDPQEAGARLPSQIRKWVL